MSPTNLTFLILIINYLLILFLSYGLFYVFYLVATDIEKHWGKVNKKIWLLLSLAAVLIYIIYFTLLTFKNFDTFYSGRLWDLGYEEQVVWNTLHGNFFRSTALYPITSHLGGHFSPIVLLLVIFYAVYQHPKTLLFLQTLFLALGAIPIFLIAKEKLKYIIFGFPFVLIYLLSPAIQNANVFEFHPLVMATPFLALAFYFLLKNKYLPSFIFCLLALTCREDISFIIFMLGIYSFFFRNKKFGLIICLFSVLWAYISIFVIIPYYNPLTRSSLFLKYGYPELGSDLFSIVRTIFLKPGFIFSSFFEPPKIHYIFYLLTPTAWLAILAPQILMIGFPTFVLNLFGGNPGALMGIYHYHTSIAVFVIISAIFSISWLSSKFNRSKRKKVIISLLLMMMFSNFLIKLTFYNKHLKFPVNSLWDKERVQKIIALIPKTASLAVSNSLGARVAQRQNLYPVPNLYFLKKYPDLFLNLDYVLIDQKDVSICNPADRPELLYNVNTCFISKEELRQVWQVISTNYKLISQEEDFLLFQKK